jgi:hypothetical protein
MNPSTEAMTQRFIDALHQLEDARNQDVICSMFADAAVLEAPRHTSGYRGVAGARRFWQEYLESFASIHSDFQQTVVGGDQAALFWTARGRLRHHDAEVTYPGVTLLEFQGDRIARFRTVFDRTPLTMAVQGRMRPPAR